MDGWMDGWLNVWMVGRVSACVRALIVFTTPLPHHPIPPRHPELGHVSVRLARQLRTLR